MFFRVYHDRWLFYSDGLGMALGEFFTRLHKAAQSEEPRSNLLNGGPGSFMHVFGFRGIGGSGSYQSQRNYLGRYNIWR